MTKRTLSIIVILIAYAAMASCVDHRPLRTEVFNEYAYLDKDFLTRENPHKPGEGDHAWLYRISVMKTSLPEFGDMPVGHYTDPKYIRFQFAPTKLEMLDDNDFSGGFVDAEGNIKPSPSHTKTILNSWPGGHVDIKMKDNLDGERTNVIEENKENDWQERQYFKVDFEKAEIADANMFGWSTTWFLNQCMQLRSVTLVPDSFELEQDAETGGDDYFAWTVKVTYEQSATPEGYYCPHWFLDAADRSTFSYELKYAFWRVPKSDYVPVEVKEKDPVRKTVGFFETGIQQRLALYQDPTNEIWGARSYMHRFDPNKPHTFYFSETFPEYLKEHMRTDVANQVNELMESIDSPWRIEFKDWNYDGKERRPGDPRWSLINYHTTPSFHGIGGYAILTADPRTGEMLSGGFNLYNFSELLAINEIQEYISEITGDTFDDQTELKTPCTPGDVVEMDEEKLASKFRDTSLYTKLEAYMGQEAKDWVPKRSENFGKYMRMLLPEYLYAIPWWNNYVNSPDQNPYNRMPELMQQEQRFKTQMSAIDHGESPFGTNNVLVPGAIETGLEHINNFKKYARSMVELRAYRQMLQTRMDQHEGWELAWAMVRNGRKCKADGTWETREEWSKRMAEDWLKKYATHEFGHAISLRHNFYGSMDSDHFNEGDSRSSIMDYDYVRATGVESSMFLPYDKMALSWIYGKMERDEESGFLKTDHVYTKEDNWLYCTDEHRAFSPLCTTSDLGITPTEIVKNTIDRYEFFYKWRNFRAYKKFWNTYDYSAEIFYTLYDLRRFLHLWAADWYASDIQNDLMLLGVEGDEYFFRNLTDEFNDEIAQANRLVINFYKAILQQSAAERTYATKFDNFYGDVTQQGIIMDKYYAMFLFVGLWPLDDYDQNIYSYLSYHESSFGNSLYWSDAQDVIDSMIGGQYDVYPWFKPTAVLLFAQDTHDVMFSDASKQKWIEMRKFVRVSDMVSVFGFDPRVQALTEDNPYQLFQDGAGNDWIYYYMVDRDVHLVANKHTNPVAYKILWDQNEALNVNKADYLDDYTIKYYLDFYEYFN